MENDRTLCVVCAWRATCNKKFTMDGATTTRCADFTKDLTLRTSEEREDQTEKEKT
jgi:hypothetical protein